jgi:hypothetical protein
MEYFGALMTNMFLSFQITHLPLVTHKSIIQEKVIGLLAHSSFQILATGEDPAKQPPAAYGANVSYGEG